MVDKKFFGLSLVVLLGLSAVALPANADSSLGGNGFAIKAVDGEFGNEAINGALTPSVGAPGSVEPPTGDGDDTGDGGANTPPVTPSSGLLPAPIFNNCRSESYGYWGGGDWIIGSIDLSVRFDTESRMQAYAVVTGGGETRSIPHYRLIPSLDRTPDELGRGNFSTTYNTNDVYEALRGVPNVEESTLIVYGVEEGTGRETERVEVNIGNLLHTVNKSCMPV